MHSSKRSVIQRHAGDLHFTSDSHFFHKKAAEMRGFVTDGGEEAKPHHILNMNGRMIDEWNENIRPCDTVIHIGDFSFAGSEATLGILSQLNGDIILVRGNHDKGLNNQTLPRFESVHDILTIKATNWNGDIQRIVCCHYPMLSWDMARHGAWHLHGHSHGTARYPFDGKIQDVGVDCNPFRKFAPFSFAEVKSIMDGKGNHCGDYHDKTEKQAFP